MEAIFYNYVHHPTVMVRSMVYDYLNGYSNTKYYAQDYDLWLRCNFEIGFTNLPEVLLKLRKHNSCVTDNPIQRENAELAVCDALSVALRKEVSLRQAQILRDPYLIVSSNEAFYNANIIRSLHQVFAKSIFSLSDKIQIRDDTVALLSNLAFISFKKSSIVFIWIFVMSILLQPQRGIRILFQY